MWRNYPQEFASLSRELRVEQTRFRNTLALLLSDCVDDEQVAILLYSPGGAPWSDPRLSNALARKLRDSYSVVLETISSMHQTFLDFVQRLRLDANGKGPFKDPNSFVEAYERFKFGIRRSSYDDLMTKVSKTNTSLAELTQSSRQLETIRALRGRTIPNFENIQARAMGLFETLQRGIHDGCKSPHRASLYLEHESPQARNRFRVVLHHEVQQGENRGLLQNNFQGRPCGLTMCASGRTLPPWIIEETEIRHLDVDQPSSAVGQLSIQSKSSQRMGKQVKFQLPSDKTPGCPSATPQASLQEIQNICQELHQLRPHQCEVCLGYVLDDSSQRYGLYWPKQPIIDRDTMTTVSLGEVVRELTGTASRQLALMLATGMMRLQGTPWLAKQWGHREVILFRKGQVLLTQHPFLSVMVKPAPGSSPAVQYFNKGPLIGNETVFALGILLIELCFRKPFQELIEREDLNADGTRHPSTDFLAANRLLSEVRACSVVSTVSEA